MPRICHVTSDHPALDTRIFRRECAGLVRCGYDVTLVAPDAPKEPIDGVEFVSIPKASTQFEQRIGIPRRAAAVAASVGADLYHFHDPALLPPMRALARKCGRPVVWDAHEDYVSTISHFNALHFAPVSRLVARWFGQVEERACRRDFAAVVTVTDCIAQRYQAWGVDTVVIGNFPDLGAIPNQLITRSERPVLLSSGAQHADRGVFEVARAFANMRTSFDCQVAFWGNFKPVTLANELRAEALAKGAPESDVLIDGPFDWRELMQHRIPYAWAGCVLFSTDHENNLEGLPNRLFEYWACNVPVIATAGSAVAQVVAAEGAGIVIPRAEPGAIAEAFRYIAEHPARRDEMALAGRNAIGGRFNWEHELMKLVQLYKRLGVQPRAHVQNACLARVEV